MNNLEKAVNLLDRAIDGIVSEKEIINALIENGADEELMSRLGIKNEMKIAGTMDWIFSKCGGNKILLINTLALLVSANVLFGHEVKKGDTMYGIAKASNCSVEELRKLNPLVQNDKIRIGDKIVTPVEIDSDISSGTYTVMEGDTFWGIARKFGMKADELAKLNPQIKDTGKLSIGETINISKKSNETNVQTDKKVNTKVKVDPKIDYIAKVLYAETSTKCTDEEAGLICRVILNRIGNKAFGGASDAYGVVKKKNAFSCTSGNDGNVNWKEYKRDLNDFTKRDYQYAEKLVKGNGDDFPGNGDIVYYCNKSMAVKYAGDGEEYGYPPGWESDVWKPVIDMVTEHFCFFKIEKK